jgi:4'-phosphopantetheinyl transferase
MEGSEDLRFNYSHSGGLAVYAFTVRADVGVDTERIRSLPDLEAIMGSMFTEAERLSLGRENRLEQFFHLWTAKEAVLKASGEGLRRPPASIEITRGTTPRVRLARDLTAANARAEWSVSTLAIADGFAGAVAVARGKRPHVVTTFDWDTSAVNS